MNDAADRSIGVTLELAAAVLDDVRVVRAVRAAHRDRGVREAFGACRARGLTVEASAVVVGEAQGMSAERVLDLVYRKRAGGRRRRTMDDGRQATGEGRRATDDGGGRDAR